VDGPLKDSTGYDLSGLFCGAEGTLGVVTRVRVRLVAPLPGVRSVAYVGMPSVAAAQGLARPGLAALEIISAEATDLVGSPLRTSWPVYVLLENPGPVESLEPVLSSAGDAVVESDAAGRARLWAYREEIAGAISAVGVPVKLDVSVPPAALPSLWESLPSVVAAVAPRARVILFGHLAEANLHVNVLSAGSADAVSDSVLRLVASVGGSISAEHGIGRAKAAYVPLTRSPAELAAMRAVKTALDPDGMMNPGVLLTPG
jgi:FAD/FMN-containing dehydrogenase